MKYFNLVNVVLLVCLDCKKPNLVNLKFSVFLVRLVIFSSFLYTFFVNNDCCCNCWDFCWDSYFTLNNCVPPPQKKGVKPWALLWTDNNVMSLFCSIEIIENVFSYSLGYVIFVNVKWMLNFTPFFAQYNAQLHEVRVLKNRKGTFKIASSGQLPFNSNKITVILLLQEILR